MTIEWSISQVPLFPMQTASSRFSKGGPRSWRDAADVNALESGKVTVQSIRQHARWDPVFTQVLDQVVSGWKSSNEEVFKQRKDELMGVYSGDHEWSFHQHCSPKFLLCYMMDSFSKWLEVAVVSAATSKNTIDKLREMFARHGIRDTMVTDNGKPALNSRHLWAGMEFITA